MIQYFERCKQPEQESVKYQQDVPQAQYQMNSFSNQRQYPQATFHHPVYLMTFLQAEKHALVTAMRFLYASGDLKIFNLAKILGVSRHAVKRRMDKFGLSVTSLEVINGIPEGLSGKEVRTL